MKAHSQEEVLAKIVSISHPYVKRMNQSNGEKQLFSIAIGTLIGSKVILLLGNDGNAHFEGDPAAWEKLEQMSDDLAEAHFQRLSKSIRAHYKGIRSKNERPYLHLMRDRKEFHWCKTTISPDEPVPIESHRLDGTTNPSFKIADKIISSLGKWKGLVDEDERMPEQIAQIIGLMAASKLMLQIWDNNKVAAMLEYIADRASEKQYKEIMEMVSEAKR